MKNDLLHEICVSGISVVSSDNIPLKNPLAVLVGQSSVLADGGGVNHILIPICSARNPYPMDVCGRIETVISIHPPFTIGTLPTKQNITHHSEP